MLLSNPLLPLKKSLAPPREYSGYEYELYHVRKQQNASNRRPGRFTTCRAIFVDFRGLSFPAKNQMEKEAVSRPGPA